VNCKGVLNLPKRNYITNPEEMKGIIGKQAYYIEGRKIMRGYIRSVLLHEHNTQEGIQIVTADVFLNWSHGKEVHKNVELGRLFYTTRKGYGKVIRTDVLNMFITKEMYKMQTCDECSSVCKKDHICSLGTTE